MPPSPPPLSGSPAVWNGQPPSERAQELIRQATTVLISHPEDMFSEVDEAVLATQPNAILADPELTEAIRASNRSNLAHWAASNLSRPGWRVSPNISPETMGLARVIAQRGIEDTSRVSYGAGQNAAWTVWMRAVFTVSSDASELREVLDFSARSVFDFVETMLSRLREEIERERGQVLSSANARRLAVINLLLGGSTSTALMEELRYRTDTFAQTAVVLSLRDGSERLLALVDAVTEAVGPRLRGRPLAVVADADTVWAWFPSGSPEGPLDVHLAAAFRPRMTPPGGTALGAKVAIGPTRGGWDGFRAHADALAAMAVTNAPVVTYDEVVMAALVHGDPERVRRFVTAWTAGLSEEMKDTLRAYLRHRCSPSKTAAATYLHRNTVIDRVRRAEARLRHPIEGHELELALALELDRFSWVPERLPRPRGAPS